jgi:hypothetical protein
MGHYDCKDCGATPYEAHQGYCRTLRPIATGAVSPVTTGQTYSVHDIAHAKGVPTAAREAMLLMQERIAELEAKVDQLREALVQHNDHLRSAAAVAARNGEDTNWLAFRGQVHYTLAEYHELVKEARAALSGKEQTDGE